jgi:hypothetical protein
VVLNARAPLSKPNGFPPLRGSPHYGKGLRPFDSAAWPRVPANRIEAAMSVASKQAKEYKMSKTETKSQPAYRIFSIVENEGEKSVWHELGAEWKHKDGKGLSLQFKALPLPGAQVVLREPQTPKTED